MEVRILNYQPDADPSTPDLLIDGNHFVPSERGMRAAPSLVDTSLAVLGDVATSSALLVKLDGSIRLFAGSSTKLYEAGVATWTDVSRTVGGAYAGVAKRWRFAQFGDITLAASKENVMQQSSLGAFANVTGGIRADIVFSVGQFIMACNTNDGGSFGDRPDSWWCSALSSPLDWTPAIATQSATGRLTSVPGKITAGRRFGELAFVGKERGSYIGEYVGPPFIWSFTELPGESGPVGQEACITLGTVEQPRIMYLARDNFYMYDGARPYPIGNGVRRKFLERANLNALDKVMMLHDRISQLVYIYYPTGSGTALTACMVYHYPSGRWGVSDRQIQSVIEFASLDITYGSLATIANYPYTNVPAIPYSDLWVTAAQLGIPAVFDTSGKMRTLNGQGENTTMTTSDYGMNDMYSTVTRVKPAWMPGKRPDSATLTHLGRRNFDDTPVTRASVGMSDSRFDLLASDRWHRFRIETQGQWEASRVDVKLEPDGEE